MHRHVKCLFALYQYISQLGELEHLAADNLFFIILLESIT